MEDKALSIKNLEAEDAKGRILTGVDLCVGRGERVALVGESGCGKTMTLRALLGFLPPDVRVTGGEILFMGEDTLHMKRDEFREEVLLKTGFVAQNTSSSLHPSLKVGRQISDTMAARRGMGREEALERAAETLSSLGLDDPQRVLSSYPWELSGGMRQRVNMAIALMDAPSLFVADEPTSALDAHVRRQIASLYERLTAEKGLSTLVVSHDLDFVRRVAGRVCVMYAGRIIEEAGTEEIFANPVHPYTKTLLGKAPWPGAASSTRRGEGGCDYASSCPKPCASAKEDPEWREVAPGHMVRCDS